MQSADTFCLFTVLLYKEQSAILLLTCIKNNHKGMHYRKESPPAAFQRQGLPQGLPRQPLAAETPSGRGGTAQQRSEQRATGKAATLPCPRVRAVRGGKRGGMKKGGVREEEGGNGALYCGAHQLYSTAYRIAGIFGGVFNLAGFLIWRVWRSRKKTPNLKTANIKPRDPDTLVVGLNRQIQI